VFAGKKEESVDAKDASVKRHFICSNIEEALVKMTGSGSKSDVAVAVKPRFYNLASAEYSNQVRHFLCVVIDHENSDNITKW
jgi:hypothetical protein